VKPIAYIHIGLEKTGTTTLQEFFFLNRNQLAQDNIYYPSSPGARNHTDLVAYAYDKTLGDLIVQKNLHTSAAREAFRLGFKELFDTELRSIKKSKTNLLVSSEHLSSRVFSKDEIRNLLRLFTEAGYLPKIIVYLRRQDQYLLSTYSTWLKCGATADLNQKAYKRKRYDYLSLLDMWGEVAGQENLIVKIFERSRMYKNDLLEDFMNILGLRMTEHYQYPSSDLNKSLDKNKLLFLKKLNAVVPESIDGQKNPLKGELIKAMEQIDNSDKLNLDPGLSQEILDYYRSDNEAIKVQYFPSQAGSLFNEKIKSVSEQNMNNEDIPLDKMYELTGALWNYQQNEINNLKALCMKLQTQIDALNGNI